MGIKELKAEIDKFLKDYFSDKQDYNKIIYDAMSYSLNIGGKRIRPILLLLTYSIFREDYSRVLPLAGALEMIHTYSLIHDDLPSMDNDSLRRGKTTNHKVFGEAVAILAGDALLNEAMNIMFEFCLGNDSKTLEACSLISKAAGAEGMIGGQVVDIMSEGTKITYEELMYMHGKKTGELIKASVLAGAVIAGANIKECAILKKFGEKLGLAFQIKDDILNVTGDKKLLGKSIHSDEENNKTNFITAFGLEKCVELCNSLTEECIGLLKDLERNTEKLQELASDLLKREI